VKNVAARKATVLIGLLLALGAAFQAGGWYQKRGSLTAAAPESRRILYYQDAMRHKSEEPGPCPECGMTMDPVYDGSTDSAAAPAADSGMVVISPDMQRTLGVGTITAARAAATGNLRLYGRVVADETRVYKITAGTDGFIRELSQATTGSIVAKHQWLATLSAPEARSALQAYLVAVDAYERTKRASDAPGGVDLANAWVQQAADRLLALGMSPLQIEEMRSTRIVPATIRVTAPGAGVVVSRDVSVGQNFGTGDELFVIADLRHVWVQAEAFGPEAEYIRPGAVAELTVPGRAGTLRATVSRRVLPEFDPATQSVKFRLEAENSDYVLRPDMFVDVHVSVSLPEAITVPAGAVLDTGMQKTVFVATGDRTFASRQIETGWQFGDRVAVVKGLDAGERVVTAGTFLLDSDSRMKQRPASSVHAH
jgi:membrane fusion protein, copper/silver efflux system